MSAAESREEVIQPAVSESRSTGHRHVQWFPEPKAELLPAPYFHVVFTCQPPLIAFQNKLVIYAIVFRCAAETLATISAEPKRAGARLDVTAVLHAWNQTCNTIRGHPPVPGCGSFAQWHSFAASVLLSMRV